MPPNPIRPGVSPVLSTSTAGLVCRPDHQPVWTYMTSSLVKWMRYHFSSASRIEFPDLVGRVWTSDPETSPIKIASLAEWTPLATDQRPAILIDRLDQDLDQSRAGIGERMMGGPPGLHAHFLAGAHVIHCLGGREGEAEILAAEVYRECSRYAHVVRESMGLIRFRASKVARRAQIPDTEGKQHYTTPILLNYYYEESWKTSREDEEEVTAIFGVGD